MNLKAGRQAHTLAASSGRSVAPPNKPVQPTERSASQLTRRAFQLRTTLSVKGEWISSRSRLAEIDVKTL